MFVIIIAMIVVVFIVRRYRRKNTRPANGTTFTSTSSHRPLLSQTPRTDENIGPINRELMPLKHVQIVENPQYQKQWRTKSNSCKFGFSLKGKQRTKKIYKEQLNNSYEAAIWRKGPSKPYIFYLRNLILFGLSNLALFS